MAPRPSSFAQRRHGSIAPGGGHSVVLSGLDPAYRYGRTLFPSRVYAPDEVARLLKDGQQSRKIGAVVEKGYRKGWPIFTLTLEERATCPKPQPDGTGCGEWASCYGNNMQAAERILHGPALIAGLRTELAELATRHPRGFMVRLHVLGDFWSVGYVEFWRQQLERLPALHLFGFTAHPPASEIGAAVTAMIDDTGWIRCAIRFSGAPGTMRASRVLAPGDSDSQAVLCPAQTGGTECCATCALCWHSDRSIAFRRH